jgi:hypothetical protein
MMEHTIDTVADAPYWMATPSKPKLRLPAGACDAHVHIFGPRARFPFAEKRSYTPSDAPKDMLFRLHERLGVQHCVIVQPACHGFDNSVTADATAATGGSYKGVALVPLTVSDAELERLNAAGLCGARFHYMGHLAAGPRIDDVIAFARRLADLGWHLQIHMQASLIAELASDSSRGVLVLDANSIKGLAFARPFFMSHMLQFIPLMFQRFPTAHGNSMRHGCDMERTCERPYAMSALPPKADMCSAASLCLLWAKSGHGANRDVARAAD